MGRYLNPRGAGMWKHVLKCRRIEAAESPVRSQFVLRLCCLHCHVHLETSKTQSRRPSSLSESRSHETLPHFLARVTRAWENPFGSFGPTCEPVTCTCQPHFLELQKTRQLPPGGKPLKISFSLVSRKGAARILPVTWPKYQNLVTPKSTHSHPQTEPYLLLRSHSHL